MPRIFMFIALLRTMSTDSIPATMFRICKLLLPELLCIPVLPCQNYRARTTMPDYLYAAAAAEIIQLSAIISMCGLVTA